MYIAGRQKTDHSLGTSFFGEVLAIDSEPPPPLSAMMGEVLLEGGIEYPIH